MATTDRRILLVAHPQRPEVAEAARTVMSELVRGGMRVCLAESDARAFAGIDLPEHEVPPGPTPARGCELVCVLGGDGTILRGADWARGTGVPILGINLGHVGFLAEAERDDLEAATERIVARHYSVEERMTLDVVARDDHGEVIGHDWALNDVTVEKWQRMIDVTLAVDERPLSSWGCDGVVVSTPTGSTAYAFSAGGPIVWPGVEALLVVPNSAHALFARPILVPPTTRLTVELRADTESQGQMWCDGRRHLDLPPGSRVEVTGGAEPVRLARLTSVPFTDRLVTKFALPVAGWRGRRD